MNVSSYVLVSCHPEVLFLLQLTILLSLPLARCVCVCVCLSYSFFIALYNLINNYCAHIYICDACLFPNLIQDFFPMNRFRSCYSICNINTHEYTHRERVNRGRAKSHIKRINTKCTKGKTERECA